MRLLILPLVAAAGLACEDPELVGVQDGGPLSPDSGSPDGERDAGELTDSGEPVVDAGVPDAGIVDGGTDECVFAEAPAIPFTCEGDEDWCDPAGDALHPEGDLLAIWSRFDGDDWVIDMRLAAPPFRTLAQQRFNVWASTSTMTWWGGAENEHEVCIHEGGDQGCVSLEHPQTFSLDSNRRSDVLGLPSWRDYLYPPVFSATECYPSSYADPLQCDGCQFDPECSACPGDEYPVCGEPYQDLPLISFDPCPIVLLGVTSPVVELRIPMAFVGDPDALRYVVIVYATVIEPDGSITRRSETSWVEGGTVVTPLGGAPDDVMDLESFCDIGCPNGVAP